MKFFHLADLHLGRTVHERDLLEDQRHALGLVLDKARTERPAFVILAGDVFDRAVPPPPAVRLFGEFVAGLKAIDPDMAIAAIPGNHDSPSRLSYLSEPLAMAGVHIRADAEDALDPVLVERDGKAARLWLLPFLTPGAFPPPDPRADEAAMGELFAAAAPPPVLRTQAELFAEAMSRLAAARTIAREREPSRPAGRAVDILVCHAFAAGGVSGESERAFLGNAELVDASLCDGFDYVALGHLHRPQAAGRAGRYPGSLLAYSFSESSASGGTERGFLRVEARPGSAEAVFEPIEPLRRMVRISCSFDRALSDPGFSPYENDYVEAILEDADAVLNPMEPLRRRFPFLLSIKQAAFVKLRPDVDEGDGGESAGEAGILEDYRQFHRELRGEVPSDEDAGLFSELLEEARRASD